MIPMRDDGCQASSYWPSLFALITTVNEKGETNVGPYQLSFPFEVIGGRYFLVCSRQNSNTDHHLKRAAILLGGLTAVVDCHSRRNALVSEIGFKQGEAYFRNDQQTAR